MSKKNKNGDENTFKVDIILTAGYCSSQMTVSGSYTESQLTAMVENIGRDYIVGNPSCTINLRFFSSVKIKYVF